MSLFAEDMILEIQNPKDVTRELLVTINEVSKATGCRVNTQKSVTFLNQYFKKYS